MIASYTSHTIFEARMLSFRFSRILVTSNPSWTSNVKIRSQSSLAILRKKTGYALNLCKKALNETQNDVTAAENWLKEEAIRNGWKKASALGNKPIAEGLIGVFVNKNCESAVLLEVNCESDFVSRNEEFRNLVSQLTKTVADASEVCNSPCSEIGQVKKYIVEEKGLEVYQDSIVTMITKLGEKIKLRRAVLFQNPTVNSNNPIKFVGYAHAVGGQPNQLDGVHIGKYGTLVAYKNNFNPDDDVADIRDVLREEGSKGGEEDDTLESSSLEITNLSNHHIAHFLAQHIIGMKPSKIRKTPEDLKREERLSKEGYKIDDEDTDSLLDQRFLLNDIFTIRQVLKLKDMQIVDFVRLECGSVDV